MNGRWLPLDGGWPWGAPSSWFSVFNPERPRRPKVPVAPMPPNLRPRPPRRRSERFRAQNAIEGFAFQSVILVLWVVQIALTSFPWKRAWNHHHRLPLQPRKAMRLKWCPRNQNPSLPKSKSVAPSVRKRSGFRVPTRGLCVVLRARMCSKHRTAQVQPEVRPWSATSKNLRMNTSK